MGQLYVKTRSEWREWLSKNHGNNVGIWLVFYKKHTQKPSLDYDAAVEEALCFGWIDSIIKKLDDERYVRKFTPRRQDSKWSESNKIRVEKLIKQGKMTDIGFEKINEAKVSGLWDKPDREELLFEIPKELEQALAKNKNAKKFFDQLAPTYQKQFIGWIMVAKQEKTKERRVDEAMILLEQGKKLGLK